jgi:hypothetical protein
MKIPKNPVGWSRIMPRDKVPPGIGDDEPPIRETLSRDPSEPPSNLGREAPGIPDGEGDEKQQLEHTVEEGVEGAADEQMRAARARRDT